MASAFVLLAVAALGLMAGALLAEAAILVPFWRSLPSESFLVWYRENGKFLLRFFGPLEVLTAMLVFLATGVSGFGGTPAAPLLGISSFLTLLVLAAFPLYFKRANASFAEGTIELERVPEELRRWARWHRARVLVALVAFLVAILAQFASVGGRALS